MDFTRWDYVKNSFKRHSNDCNAFQPSSIQKVIYHQTYPYLMKNRKQNQIELVNQTQCLSCQSSVTKTLNV